MFEFRKVLVRNDNTYDFKKRSFRKSHSSFVVNCSDPLEGGGTIYSNGFFLFREFSPLDIFIAES